MDRQDIRCCVCLLDYDDSRLPRNFRCGHSVCSTCLDLIILTGNKCPECRKIIRSPNSLKFPINYPLIRFSRVIAYKELDPKVFPELKLPISYPSLESQLNAGECPSHGCSLFFVCLRCNVSVCRKCLATDHLDPPRGKCFIIAVGKAIEKIKKYNQAGKQYLNESDTVLKKLEKVLRIATLTYRIIKHLSCEDRTQNFNKSLEDIKKKIESIEVSLSSLDSAAYHFKKINEKVANFNLPHQLIAAMRELHDRKSDLEKYLQEEKKRGEAICLKVITDKNKVLIEQAKAGRPFYAIHEEGERLRWSRMVFRNDCIHLYSLRDGIFPDDGVTIPYVLLRDLVNKTSRMVFLEIGWGGKTRGAIYISLFGDTPRGQQAMLLCSGEKGPSFRNTSFYKVKNFRGCQILCGGDYENNDGTGGQAFVEGITLSNQYRHTIVPGLVCGPLPKESHRLGSFAIHLQGVFDHVSMCSYGKVDSGLDILMKAAEIIPLCEVSVVDCGLIF